MIARVVARLGSIWIDTSPLRVSRDFRLLWTGQTVSDFGSHITMVAAPFQVYKITHSSLAVGLLGLCWLVPLLSLSVFGGSIADAVDRRRLLRISFGVLPLFSAVLAWQLGGLPATTLAALRVILWSFAGCYVVIAVLTWRYFFMAPLAFAVLVALSLALAAWRGSVGAT